MNDSKIQSYQLLKAEIIAVLDDETDKVAQMATLACLASQTFDYWFWTGFYLVDQTKRAQGIDELVVGPYQGTLGCLRIEFSRGVCGAAARTGQTQIVKDVHEFEGHIACDTRTNSEIVVPVFDSKGELLAVFDVDSERLGAFDEVDQTHLEDILKTVFGT
jgi:L-methionine (R)-S-oxide reductase